MEVIGRVRVVVLLLVGLLTACSGADRTCTAIGQGETIGIDVSRILDHQRGPVDVRTCIGDTCESGSAPDGRRLDVAYVDDRSIDNLGPYQVELVIGTGSGETIYEQRTSFELNRLQPNGPECPPTWYGISLVATPEGLHEM